MNPRLHALLLAACHVRRRAAHAWWRSRLAERLSDLELRVLTWDCERRVMLFRDSREHHTSVAQIAAVEESRLRRELWSLRVERETRTERVAPTVYVDWDARR